MAPYHGPLIDAHHHLWDIGMRRHPWLEPAASGRDSLGDLAPLRRNYLPADYRRDAANQNVLATVHVEANWTQDDCVGETAWLIDLPDRSTVAERLVAHVPLASGNAPALLEAQAAHERVVGIRDILSWHPDPSRQFAARGDLMDDPNWRAGLSALRRHGLSFDLMVLPNQHQDALRLARDFPDQIFLLNHCGSPIDRDEDGMERWRRGVAALAEAPNVAIKISDLVAYDHDWTSDSLRSVVLHCIDCFGTDRAMFASDFPVAGLHATFDEIFDGFREFTADFSPDEQSNLFWRNAARFYRFDSRALPPGAFTPGEKQETQDQ